MKNRVITMSGLVLATALMSGCAAVVAGTAGGLIADEGLNENDGTFDPLENTEIGQEAQEVFD
ncbi:MAG: hypothetical protein AAF415_17870 [Pseudomonadota bacterium]